MIGTKRPREPEDSSNVQYLVHKDEHEKIIRNSPYGISRVNYGWGTPFQQPVSCIIPAMPSVRIGLASLNAVPEKERTMTSLLQRYMKKYNILEHCQTYHSIGEQQTWEKWRDLPGKRDFVFTVKANQFLTHTKMLEMDDTTAQHIDKFFNERCRALGDRLAAVLVQLPPNFHNTPGHMERLRAVAAAIPPSFTIAVEFRHSSWFKEETYALLRSVHWTLVVTHNEETGETPLIDTGTNLLYVRLHGSLGRSVGDYGPALMKRWAETIWSFVSVNPRERRVFFMLNNNESHIQNLTSSTVDASCLANLLREKAAQFPPVHPTAQSSTKDGQAKPDAIEI